MDIRVFLSSNISHKENQISLTSDDTVFYLSVANVSFMSVWECCCFPVTSDRFYIGGSWLDWKMEVEKLNLLVSVLQSSINASVGVCVFNMFCDQMWKGRR